MKIAKNVNRLGTEAVYSIFAKTQKLAKQGKISYEWARSHI